MADNDSSSPSDSQEKDEITNTDNNGDKIDNDTNTVDETNVEKKESSDEEFCRHCQTKGNLVLCDSCPAGYHAICAKLEEGKVRVSEAKIFFT